MSHAQIPLLSLTKACRRPPIASAPASLRLSAALEARRYRAKTSLASLAGCKSLSGKDEPSTRIESCVHGGVVETRRTRWTKRRQRILEAAGVTAHPEVLVQLRKGACCGRRGFSRTPKATHDHPYWPGWKGPPESSGRGMQEERRRSTWETPAAPARGKRRCMVYSS